MPFVQLDDIAVHYRLTPASAGRPALVFVNSLGTDFRIWDEVCERLDGAFSMLCYDLRGHGLSGTGATPFTLAQLAADAARLLDRLGIGPAIVCGVSLGGMVAQQLYADRPDLVRALVLCDTALRIGDAAFWAARIETIRHGGMDAVADSVIARWFSPDFGRVHPEAHAGYLAMLERQPADGYIAACAALAEADLSTAAERIAVPTCCVVGQSDASTPPALVRSMAQRIPNARFEVIPDCGHLPSVEQPERLAAILRDFVVSTATEAASHASQ